MEIVVSDTSPIRALHHLGLLDLLPRLFEPIVIPPAVLDELARVRVPRQLPDMRSFRWVRVQRPKDNERVRLLEAHVDPGEAEAIALALELRSTILIDELDGRAVATRLGLEPLGVLGILVRCKARGWIPEVGPLIDRLRSELRFHVSESLRAKALQMAGEATDQ